MHSCHNMQSLKKPRSESIEDNNDDKRIKHADEEASMVAEANDSNGDEADDEETNDGTCNSVLG